MNMRQVLAVATLATAAFGATGTAHAEDLGLSTRVATGVGYWIAAQGNAALVQIRDDLRQELNQAMKPLLPEPAPAPAENHSQPAADRPATL